jgi:hypothetical protein
MVSVSKGVLVETPIVFRANQKIPSDSLLSPNIHSGLWFEYAFFLLVNILQRMYSSLTYSALHYSPDSTINEQFLSA